MNQVTMNGNALAANLLARLDRLPGWPFPWYILAIIGASYFFCFYDIIVIGTTLPKIIVDFKISQQLGDWAVTSNLIGYIVGAFFIARLADHLGRRLSLIVSISLYSLGTILCAFSQHIDNFLVWRFISGMGVGAELACAVTYLSELSPSRSRGRNTTIASSCGFLGFAITPFIAMLVLNHLQLSWRVLFLIAGLSGLITLCLRPLIPKSPRWLIKNNRFSDAEKIIQRAEEQTKKSYPGLSLPPLSSNDLSSLINSNNVSVWQLLCSPHLKNLLLIMAIFVFYYIGNYGWLTLNVSLLTDLGYAFSSSVVFISLSSLGFVAGSIFVIWFADKIERKWLCCTIALLWALTLFIIGFWPSHSVIAIFGFIACATISAIMPIMYSYAAENFPTSHRATAVALTDGIGHIGGAFSGQIVFAAFYCFHTAHSSFAAALSVMAFSGLITAILFTFGNKMTGRSLN
ncbi:MAG: MFS transporter [Gammaproteobacteria bacterium]|nr:MFS transporter [Gammaproteobacteria bacterium]